ncbi:MAG: hypothetical protein WBA88_09685 [Pseudaminobacter sp.]
MKAVILSRYLRDHAEKAPRITARVGNVAKAGKNRNNILTFTDLFRTTYVRPDRG